MERYFEPGQTFAAALDEQDPIADMRSRFYVKENEIYMDGNSLGLCSKDAEAAVFQMLENWKNHGINIWNVENGRYFLYPSYLGARMAPLVGAKPNEVTVTNSTTINIHQCISTFYKPNKHKYKILVDDLNFPTDLYAVDSQVRLFGYAPEDAVKVVKSADGKTIDEDAIIENMTEDVALILLPSVLYRSAQLVDMARVTKEARKRNIPIGWDLCHSIGAVSHALSDIGADFAIWCNYKYLSAGPGAIAGIYINERHFGTMPGLTGWHGNRKETQFQLLRDHEPAQDADAWLTGTPPLLSMAAIEGILNIYEDAGMARVRAKSLHLTAYMMYLIDTRLKQYGYSIGTPREDHRRGGHVALEHAEAYRICQALKANGVIPDFREPNVVRLAPAALYVRYQDVYRVVGVLEKIARNEEYKQFSNARALVV